MSGQVGWRNPSDPSDPDVYAHSFPPTPSEQSFPSRMKVNASNASASNASASSFSRDSFQDVSQSESLEAQFENDFEQHLKRKNAFKKLTYGAVGAVGGGALGFAASPIVLPGLAVAAFVGGASGYQWAKTKGKRDLKRHARRPSDPSRGEGTAQGALPTLRRLKYLAKWGHWQLLDYAESPAEWRWSVLDEVVKAFFPWVQRMHGVLPSESDVWEEVCPEMNEVLQNLSPLYLFLQRRVVREAFYSAAKAVSSALDEGNLDSTSLDRCRFLFPIVLDISMQIERLDWETFQEVLQQASQRRRGFFASEGDPRHQRQHKQLMDTLMRLMERNDVQALISSSQQLQRSSRSDNTSAWAVYGGGSSPSQGVGFCHLESLESFLEEPLPDSPSLPPSRDAPVLGERRGPPPLVLPPEGAENEPGLGLDHASDDEEAEFLSCSSGSDDEQCTETAEDQALLLAKRIAEKRSSEKRNSNSGATAFEQRSARFPQGDGIHSWRGSDEHAFDVRSETYLHDKRKEPSGPAMFEAVSMEIIRVGPAGPVWRVAKHGDFFPAFSRARGDNRFFIVHNWVFPPYQAILIGALNPDALWQRTPDLPQARLWKRFLEMEPAERNELFKVIISIDEGPWLVKRAAQKKPVIIGRKVKMNTFYEPDDHLEIVIDISTGKAEQMAVSIVMRALKSLKVSIATLLEGRTEDELPEALMFCGAVKYMDLSQSGFPRSDARAC